MDSVKLRGRCEGSQVRGLVEILRFFPPLPESQTLPLDHDLVEIRMERAGVSNL